MSWSPPRSFTGVSGCALLSGCSLSSSSVSCLSFLSVFCVFLVLSFCLFKYLCNKSVFTQVSSIKEVVLSCLFPCFPLTPPLHGLALLFRPSSDFLRSKRPSAPPQPLSCQAWAKWVSAIVRGLVSSGGISSAAFGAIVMEMAFAELCSGQRLPNSSEGPCGPWWSARCGQLLLPEVSRG